MTLFSGGGGVSVTRELAIGAYPGLKKGKLLKSCWNCRPKSVLSLPCSVHPSFMYGRVSARLVFSGEGGSGAVFAGFSFGIGRVSFKWQPTLEQMGTMLLERWSSSSSEQFVFSYKASASRFYLVQLV